MKRNGACRRMREGVGRADGEVISSSPRNTALPDSNSSERFRGRGAMSRRLQIGGLF